MQITDKTKRSLEIALTFLSISSILLSFWQFKKQAKIQKLQLEYFETQLKE
jgi:hypothetical protein